ncbi:MAG: FkbM family methyltransferase [Bacteroidota bacterium]
MLAPWINRILPHLNKPSLYGLIQLQDWWRSVRGRGGGAWPAALAAQRELFFVHVGANRAGINDPIFRQIILRDWRGILVEPQEAALAHWRQTLRHYPGLYYAQTTLAERAEERDFFYIEPEAGLPEWITQVSSLRREVTQETAGKIPGARVRGKRLTCLSLDQLLAQYQVRKFDVLVIDAEGADAQILKGLSLDRYRPQLIRYEHYHLDPEERRATEARLKRYGYEVVREGYDTLAERVGK